MIFNMEEKARAWEGVFDALTVVVPGWWEGESATAPERAAQAIYALGQDREIAAAVRVLFAAWQKVAEGKGGA